MRLHWLLALAMTVGASSYAADKKTESTIAKKHQNLFGAIDNLKVQFNQDTYRKLRNKTIPRRGTAYFSRPDHFKWVYDKSETSAPEEYYYDGTTLSHYQPLQNQVTEYGTKSAFIKELQNVVNLVLDPNKLLGDFEVADSRNEKNNTMVTLVPRKKGTTDIEKITVQVSDQRKYVKEVKIQYLDGNATSFEFKNPRFSTIPADTFKFKNPGNVKVKRVG